MTQTALMTAAMKSTKDTVMPCGDGCGEMANVGRAFRPGHDARLAKLLQAVADGEEVRTVKLVTDRIASGEYPLPEKRFETHEITLTVTVRVGAGEGRGVAAGKLAERIELKGWAHKVKAQPKPRTAKATPKATPDTNTAAA